MAGTKEGGIKARNTNLKNDPNFYKKIGAVGGKKGNTGGFYYMKENGQHQKVREAGRKGGLKSRRTKKEE